MALNSAVPMSEVGPADQPPNQVLVDFISAQADINYVNESVGDTDISTDLKSTYVLKDYVERYVANAVKRCKQRRQGLEQGWLAIQRMVVKMFDENQKYRGNSNAYIPVYKRNRTTLVSTLSRGLFPTDEYIDVVDREQGDNDSAKACKCVIQYELEHSGLRRTIKGFLGQYVDFGISVLKWLYKKDVVSRGGIPTTQNPTGMYEEHCEGLEVVTRSMFNIVVFPEHADKKEQLTLEAERMDVPIDYVNDMHRSGRWENVKDALQRGGGKNDEFEWLNTATLSDVANIPNTMELRDEKGSPLESVIIVEAWCRLLLPKRAYAPNEPIRPVPCRVVFINQVAVLVKRNPYHHQQSPFTYARDNQIVGSFYSDGAGADTQGLQYLANDHFNQLNDCLTYGMMPMWLVNPNYIAGPMEGQRPGRVWKVRDVEKAMKPVLPDINNVQYGSQHTMNVVSMAQEAPGAPKIMQGAATGKTATSDQIAQNNAQAPMQDKVEDLEHDIMLPGAEMTWYLSRQYRSIEFIRQLGERPMKDPMGNPIIDPTTGQPVMEPDLVRFLPSDINISPQFRMLSSNQSANRQVRQQGLMVFTDLAMKLGPNLQMQGKMLNPEPILQRAWSDGLGNRGFDKVIIPMPMMPMAPPGPGGSPGLPMPGPVGTAGQGGSTQEPAAGEGDVTKPMMDGVQANNAQAGKQNQPRPNAPDVIPF